MVAKIVYEDCRICGSHSAHTEIEEGFFCGVKRCTVCFFLRRIDEEWPKIYFKRKGHSYAINKFPNGKSNLNEFLGKQT